VSRQTGHAPTEAAESPKLQARRQAFLAAAAEVFARKGFASATLDDVIARSGGSRQTLYALFGGKQGLFEALLTEKCQRIFGGMTMEQVLAQPVDEALTGLATRFLTVVTSKEAISLQRLVLAEAQRMPELVEVYWKQGPGRGRARLACYLASQTERGILHVPDPELAASAFWGMLHGPFQLKLLLGLREPPDTAEIKAVAEDCVGRFLDGCRAAPGPKPTERSGMRPAAA
jgi:AcrR family transcriptional regulator